LSGKFALIIGNTEYTDPGLAQLSAPGKDAEDFARVLENQEICAFDRVNILLNEPEYIVRGAIEELFDQKKPDDLLVLYFSGHGVRDESGALYLAVKNTNRFRLRSSAIKSDFIRETMDHSRSKREVLILDCCNSGAFAQGTKAATGVSLGTATAFEAGYGRMILTASDSTQFAWEGNQVIGEIQNSLFTHFLVEGLKGEADLDSDGRITVDELYDYAYEQTKLVTPNQTPSKFSSKQQGEIVLRQITRIADIKPITLPDQLLSEIDNPYPEVRLRAVQQLARLLQGKNLGLARSAREVLERMEREDDSRRVVQAAIQALEPIRQAEELEHQKAEEERLAAEKAEADRKAKEETERLLAAQRAEEERKAREAAQRLAALDAKEEQLRREKAEADMPTLKPAEIPVAKKPIAKLQILISKPVLYGGIGLVLLIGLALLGNSLRSMNPGTTPVPSETEEPAVDVNPPLQATLLATKTIPVPPPSPTLTIPPSPVSTASVETPASIPVNGTSVSITANRAYLYKGPDIGFGLAVQIAYLRGETFTVLGRNQSGLWFFGKVSDGTQGWLYRDWLDIDVDPLVIPTASFIPTIRPTERPGGGGGPTATEPCVFPPCP
jgi:hypothetical protein